jgi:glycosyltransferase involved in cell wall biosynthesis
MAAEDPRVIMTGFVKGEAYEELYSNCFLYVLPRDMERMPLTLLDAMNYGNCCLVSDIEECMEVVENQGIRFHKSQIPDLKDKLKTLSCSSDTTQDYKKKTAAFVAKKHCWNTAAEETGYLHRM